MQKRFHPSEGWNRSEHLLSKSDKHLKQIFIYCSILLNLAFVIGLVFVVQRMGGWRALVFRYKNQGIGLSYLHRADILQKLPITQASKIIFLGDSHTQQCEWAELFENQQIINRGIIGDVTEGLLKRLPTIVAIRPQKVFLMIGVNDLFVGVQQETMISNYQKIVQILQTQSPTTKIVVQSVLPINNKVRQTNIDNQHIASLNSKLQRLATQQKVTFIDLTAAFTDKNADLRPEFTFDGVHLNGNGYAAWRETIKNEL
jgi:lysophospholipase L1-like esterase